MGSLGQYAQEFDVAANLTVFNVSLANAGTGARIKVWPGVESSEGALLDGGGGAGYVRNVTYWVLNNTNNDWAIQIDQSVSTFCPWGELPVCWWGVVGDARPYVLRSRQVQCSTC